MGKTNKIMDTISIGVIPKTRAVINKTMAIRYHEIAKINRNVDTGFPF